MPMSPAAGGGANGMAEGPWNPGIASEIPSRLLPLATLYRPENSFVTAREARELADITGLPAEDMVVYRPQRLVIHELLARVTADYTVEDGDRSEALGINFRRMCHTLLSRHIEPHLPQLVADYEALRKQLREIIDAELRPPSRQSVDAPGGVWNWLKRASATRSPAAVGIPLTAESARSWRARSLEAGDPVQASALRALARVTDTMLGRHGRPWGDAGFVAQLALGLACNDHGSVVIGQRIDPLICEGARVEGFRRLPPQREPLVMNTKGASAAGKSTLRPLQRALAARIGVDWRDFALVSPDIFRKFLLDYATLGAAYKYAGSFTGHELQVVDRKLDRHIEQKAIRGEMTHLLIDRFRFDTFAPASEIAGSNLLTRFATRVFLFFVITPPHATVERAWQRGLEVGRYKAVDDLLAHNIEAFSGMPEVFFTWALSHDKQVHYEFLDNDVTQGQKPRTVAFGWNGEMNVLNVKCLLDVERYRRINVEARTPDVVYAGPRDSAPQNNVAFLNQCVQRLSAVNFADSASGRIYLRIENGVPAWHDPAGLAQAMRDPETAAGIAAIAPKAMTDAMTVRTPGPLLGDQAAGKHGQTLGAWNAD